jgi:hypothetical protein
MMERTDLIAASRATRLEVVQVLPASSYSLLFPYQK